MTVISQNKLMDDVNLKLNELAILRRELLAPSIIWGLAKLLKSGVRELDLNADNESLVLNNSPGIYYFEAKFNFTALSELNRFGDIWGKIRASNLPVGIPRYYPRRAQHHSHRLTGEKFVPFYLGKRENLSDRVINHLDGEEGSGTYSLKLRSRPSIIENIEFRYSVLEFSIESDAYFGVELLEAKLREIFNPIVGKQ